MVAQSIVGCVVRPSLVSLILVMMFLTATETVASQPDALRFEVRLGRAASVEAGSPHQPGKPVRSGRLLVILGKPGTDEPRLTVGQTGKNASPILGRDVARARARCAWRCSTTNRPSFPSSSLSRASTRNLCGSGPLAHQPRPEPGQCPRRSVQPRDDRAARPGGRWYDQTRAVSDQCLRRRCRPTQELVKYLKIRSRLLCDFHGRPIDLRAGVILPRDFDQHPERALPGQGSHRRLRFPIHRGWGDDESRIRVSPRLDGRGCAPDDPYSPGRCRPAGRPLPGRFGQPWTLWRGRHTRVDPPDRRQIPRSSAAVAPAWSTAARQVAGWHSHCRFSTPSSSTVPGPSARTASIFARFSS